MDKLKEKKEGDFNCIKCKNPMPRPTRSGECKYCRRFVDRVPKDLTPKMLRCGYVSPEDTNTIRMLLVKYKHGFINAIDYYKIVSLYTEINGLVGGYDDFPIDKQIKLMMKNFSLYYNINITK